MWGNMKRITILFIFLSTILFAQERMILRTNGEQIKLNHKKDLQEAITESKIKRSDGKVFDNQFISSPQNINGVVDTIAYRRQSGSFNNNFGFFGQDAMLMWFEAPADMVIKAIGFTCSDDTGAVNASVSLRLIRLNWTKERLKNITSATLIGYYPSIGDGFNEIDMFGEEATSGWVSKDSNYPLPPWTDNVDPEANTFDYDIWSDAGFPWPITPVASPHDAPVYQWNEASGEPAIKQGDLFAVVATNNGINLDSSRIGFWSDNSIGYPGWKFYENGRSDSDVDQGWWVRGYTWDFAVAVDIISSPYLIISDITQVPTSSSTEPRKINATLRDANPSSGTSGISEVNLKFTVNDGETQTVVMEHIGDNIFEGYIPHSECSTIEYWIEAIDVNNYKNESQSYSYRLFCPSNRTLLVFNGFNQPSGYPQSYYFGQDDFGNYTTIDFPHDAWAFGPVTKELLENYNTVIEICSNNPTDDNRAVIEDWFASENLRVYILWGQEWHGQMSGFTDVDFMPGDFEYDILGLTKVYNDVSFDGTSGQELPSRFLPQEGTGLGDPMFDFVAEMNNTDSITIDSVLYDPIREFGGVENWHDGFEVREDDETLEVFMKAETRGIMGAPEVRNVNVGVSRNLGRSHMSVFMAYDPLVINTAPYYYWLGFSEVSSQVQAIKNIPITPNVNDDIANIKFSLSQNYPNPFNPSTTIKYSIPVDVALNATSTNVKLTVYDILGREIETIVNKEQKPGNYEVQFDASNLTSGIYFYKLDTSTGSASMFTESKKMILLK
jgi:Secretion system C-terminal sorting domain